jgi:hypothetical protein
MRIYGYVVMPEHVHLLASEPERGLLTDAIHYLKLNALRSGLPPRVPNWLQKCMISTCLG